MSPFYNRIAYVLKSLFDFTRRSLGVFWNLIFFGKFNWFWFIFFWFKDLASSLFLFWYLFWCLFRFYFWLFRFPFLFGFFFWLIFLFRFLFGLVFLNRFWLIFLFRLLFWLIFLFKGQLILKCPFGVFKSQKKKNTGFFPGFLP